MTTKTVNSTICIKCHDRLVYQWSIIKLIINNQIRIKLDLITNKISINSFLIWLIKCCCCCCCCSAIKLLIVKWFLVGDWVVSNDDVNDVLLVDSVPLVITWIVSWILKPALFCMMTILDTVYSWVRVESIQWLW